MLATNENLEIESTLYWKAISQIPAINLEDVVSKLGIFSFINLIAFIQFIPVVFLAMVCKQSICVACSMWL